MVDDPLLGAIDPAAVGGFPLFLMQKGAGLGCFCMKWLWSPMLLEPYADVILAASSDAVLQDVDAASLARCQYALCCSWDQFHDLDAPQMVLTVNWAAAH
ncbi:hypothetical protein Nepgr_005316 [Nepenthes gracilis]|uniref:Uncharacterized protein n=1 Tax=Nepenthes gracilis TaxID=150966 RepID=A0AAD3XGB2_NEPGR|nr:hypothetical protein Nepgr_005316 [Nepenthes gracilis]